MRPMLPSLFRTNRQHLWSCYYAPRTITNSSFAKSFDVHLYEINAVFIPILLMDDLAKE